MESMAPVQSLLVAVATSILVDTSSLEGKVTGK